MLFLTGRRPRRLRPGMRAGLVRDHFNMRGRAEDDRQPACPLLQRPIRLETGRTAALRQEPLAHDDIDVVAGVRQGIRRNRRVVLGRDQASDAGDPISLASNERSLRMTARSLPYSIVCA